MKQAIRNLGKRIALTGYYLVMRRRLPRLFDEAHRSGELKYLSDEDLDIWKGAFMALLREHFVSNYGYAQRELLTAFPAARIETVRRSPACDPNLPIVLLCVKDDRRRIEMLMKHYRGLGVAQFAFIDNGSTDGTLEWLLEQPDVDVYRTSDHYSSAAKEAWINRLVSLYGFDRWYIQTDSDELVKYAGMETHSLAEVVRWAEARGLKRLEGLTLDMYCDAGVYAQVPGDRGIEDVLCWMDTDSYTDQPKQVGGQTVRWLTGGPRMRKMGVSTSLMKFPLVRFEPGTVSANAHFLYPYDQMNTAPCCLAIMHYKFLEEDRAEYARRAQAGSGFAFNGGYYRNYLGGDADKGSFMYAGSRRYVDSRSLEGLPYIETMTFEENGR